MNRIFTAALRTLCACSLLAAARADLVHRWSFNEPAGAVAAGTVFSDTISGAQARLIGTGATASGTALTLPGTTTGNQTPAAISAYVDLPNGIISSKTNLTVEIWAAPVSHQSFQRLLDFGRVVQVGDGLGAPGEITGTAATAPGTTQSSDALTLSLSRGNLSQQRLEGKLNGTTVVDGTGLYRIADTNLATTGGTEYHYVMTFEDGVGAFGAAGGRVSWYRNGLLAAALDVGFRLNQIEDVNNWLGRSLFSADRQANAAYNEVRIYDQILGAAAIAASGSLGPNPAPPTATADAIAVRHGQKVRIPVLANDANGVLTTVVQPPGYGTAVADADGRILYTHTSGLPASDSFTYRAVNGAGASVEMTVTVTFSPGLRLENPLLNVPSNPPPTSYSIVNAFTPNITFTDPTCLATPPGDTQRLFVCQKGGLLRVMPDVTAASPAASTFLDLPSLLATRNEALSTNSEQGLLGLAFHPDYASNGYFFIFYSVDKIADDGNTTTPIYERVSRFSVQAGNPNAADPASELVLIEQFDQAGNHNGGDLHFGPDGYLYISLGDEGDQNDTRNNSQRITKDFFSGILRIDVDKRPGNLEPNAHPNPAESVPVIDAIPRDAGIARYSIPADNPFVLGPAETWDGTYNGAAISAGQLPYVRSEFWATGLRNPWRMSFDPATGELWVGDVGGGVREEVDIVTAGKNYGWAYREGFINGPKSAQAPVNFDALYHTLPIYDYEHTSAEGDPNFEGNSITGGIVYRGATLSNLVGAYIFADYASAHVWTLRRNGAAAPTVERITSAIGIVAFGRDPSNGDVLMASINNDRIYRLTGSAAASTFPQALSATDLFADLGDLSPNPGLVPYSVNLPFWSDHAIKRRWFTIPDAGSTMTWSRDGLWSFPAGQIWVKHFDLELERGNPATAKRIETRVLVRNGDGAYGVSYRWDDAGTDATLVADEGVSFPVNVTVGGTPAVQTWSIPSRAQCIVCHTPQAGHALSFTTRQLNRTDNLLGAIGNQLDLLRAHGYFSNQPDAPNTLPRHVRADETSYAVEARARSYLAVNCAYCHQPGGSGAPAQWDGRPEMTLAQTGLINGSATNNGGDPLNKLIVPGDAAHSVVLQRIAAANGFTRMPPLGSNELDQAAIDLVTQWIGHADLVNRQGYAQWRQVQFGSTTSQEGEPGANPDSDESSNQREFLLGTLPLVASAPAAPQLALDAFNVSITLEVPANRAVQVEVSPDLQTWTAWDAPGNDAVPRPAGPVTFIGPRMGEQQYFRLRIWEN